ncbi:MAG: GNAT family N-acetyltransferase [Anaerolineae bacterium]
MKFEIRDLIADDTHITQAGEILHLAFVRDFPGSWATVEEGIEEVRELLTEADAICRIAYHNGRVLGWIGGLPQYDGHVWELHPLAVHPDWQGRGIGRALVQDLEAQVHNRGGLTIMLGSDDVSGMTSLGGVDLYPDPLAHLARIENRRQHPYGFYQKLGYCLLGVIPDANGLGKPDILMGKRVSNQTV